MVTGSDRVFRSGVALHGAILCWGIAAFFWIAALVALSRSGLDLHGVALATGSALIGFGVSSFLKTTYTITPTELRLRSGVIKKTIRLTDIRSVSTSRTAMALNIAMDIKNVLEIESENSRFAYRVTPADPQAFLGTLARACPHLAARDGGLHSRR